MGKGPKGQTDGLADSLAEATLIEMAGTFFGQRREVETLLERIQELAAELDGLAAAVLAKGTVLHLLVTGGQDDADAVAGLYQAIGIEPGPFLTHVTDDAAKADLSRLGNPLALTAKGKWVKLVLAAYAAFQAAVEEYLHGSYVDDPERPGRKRPTPSLASLQRLAEATNERIKVIASAPSQVLRYAHSMDVHEADKERLVGGTLEGYADAVDKSMGFTPVDVAAFDLPELPDLPLPDAARKPLQKYLNGLAANHPDRVQQGLSLVRNDATS
jgi:hypothetical protein